MISTAAMIGAYQCYLVNLPVVLHIRPKHSDPRLVARMQPWLLSNGTLSSRMGEEVTSTFHLDTLPSLLDSYLSPRHPNMESCHLSGTHVSVTRCVSLPLVGKTLQVSQGHFNARLALHGDTDAAEYDWSE